MTEASHQMTSNLLPPKRKVGSVGVPTGINVKTVDDNFKKIKSEQVGEDIDKR